MLNGSQDTSAKWCCSDVVVCFENVVINPGFVVNFEQNCFSRTLCDFDPSDFFTFNSALLTILRPMGNFHEITTYLFLFNSLFTVDFSVLIYN